MTVFLVEQNAFHALKLAHRGYVMVNGIITMTGTGQGASGAIRRSGPPISKAGGTDVERAMPSCSTRPAPTVFGSSSCSP